MDRSTISTNYGLAMMRKEIWIGWLSSLIEAYNMAIYSFLVPILIPHFGKPRSHLLSYSLVFVGSFFYPIGAAYYGLLVISEEGEKPASIPL